MGDINWGRNLSFFITERSVHSEKCQLMVNLSANQKKASTINFCIRLQILDTLLIQKSIKILL